MSKEYKKPPIVEAIIAIKFANPVSIKLLSERIERFLQFYESNEKIYRIEARISEDGEVNSKRTHEGFKFISEDATNICVVERSGLSISKLAPYCGWDVLIKRFFRDYDFWSEIYESKVVARLGTRYINRIDIPLDFDGANLVENYLELYMHTPNSSDVFNDYSARISLPGPYPECDLVVNTGTKESPLIKRFSVMLDIDVGWKPKNDLKIGILELFNKMRVIKNESFERFITDKTKELFD